MKIKSKIRHPRGKTLLLLLCSVVVIIAIIGLVLAYSFKVWPFSRPLTPLTPAPSINYEKATDEQIKAGDDVKRDTVDSDTPPVPVSQPGSDKKSVEIIITAANQNNDLLQVRTQIATVTSAGKCTLTLTRSGKVVSKITDVQPLASTSTCMGFDVPVSELSVGSWQATLVYESDSLEGYASTLITIK